jgi:hypothetical protein
VRKPNSLRQTWLQEKMREPWTFYVQRMVLGLTKGLRRQLEQHFSIIFINLKVPKRENFSLAFFAQSEPTWVCDLGSGEKNRIFYQMTPVFGGFWFFAAY